MRNILTTGRGQEGFVLITSMLFMMLVVVVGIMATNTSTVEVQISGLDKFHQMAFFGGDSGVYTTAKLIAEAREAHKLPPNPNIREVSATYYDEIMGFVPPPVPDDEAKDKPHQVEFDLGGELKPDGTRTGEYAAVTVDVIKLGSGNNVGGGNEFPVGNEGAGGTPPQVYQVDSAGHGPKNSSSEVLAVYRRYEGTPGGL